MDAQKDAHADQLEESLNPFTNDAAREILLTEYKSLRDEMFKKMDHRTTLSVSLITVSMVALGTGIERRSSDLLLVTPLVCILFGLLIAFNNYSIYGITRYIRTTIEAAFVRWQPGVFAWHNVRPPDKHRMRELLAVYHIPNILAVYIPSIAAMTAAWNVGGSLLRLLIVTAIDGLLLAAYAALYWRVARGSIHIRVPEVQADGNVDSSKP